MGHMVRTIIKRSFTEAFIFGKNDNLVKLSILSAEINTNLYYVGIKRGGGGYSVFTFEHRGHSVRAFPGEHCEMSFSESILFLKMVSLSERALIIIQKWVIR